VVACSGEPPSPLPDMPAASARGRVCSLHNVNVLPIIGFYVCSNNKNPSNFRQKNPKRQIVLTVFLVPNDKNIPALSHSYNFIENISIFLYRHLERS